MRQEDFGRDTSSSQIDAYEQQRLPAEPPYPSRGISTPEIGKREIAISGRQTTIAKIRKSVTGEHFRVPRRWSRVAALAMALTTSFGAIAPPALAHDTTGGLWYYYDTGVADVLPSTPQGAGIKIALIDGAINPDVPELAGTNIQIREQGFCRDEEGNAATRSTELDAFHATAMAALQVGTGRSVDGREGNRGVSPRAEILHYQANGPYDAQCWTNGSRYMGAIGDAIQQAIDDGARVLSLSLGSFGRLDDSTRTAISRANREGVVIVAADCHLEGHGHRSDGKCWPAGGNGVVVVEAVDRAGRITEDNLHGRVSVVAPGKDIQQLEPQPQPGGPWTIYRLAQGSSPATAWTAGVLATVWSKYPDASGNQMIQSLIRNADRQEPGRELSHDPYYGYGMVSITRMVQTDPRTYPDVNPLLEDSPTRSPAYTDCLPSTAPASVTATGAAVDHTAGIGGQMWVIVAGLAGVGVIAGGAVVFALRRSQRKSDAAGVEA